MRNLRVAIKTGVNPSFNAILTTTNELPQKIIRVNIRNALKRLIVLVVIREVTLLSNLKRLFEKQRISSKSISLHKTGRRA